MRVNESQNVVKTGSTKTSVQKSNNVDTIKFPKTQNDGNKSTRPMGYNSAHTNTEENKRIAQMFFDAMYGIGTDKELMDKATKLLTKYNIIEVLDEFQKIDKNKNGKNIFDFIRGDFSKLGGGSDWLGDDCKPYMQAITSKLCERANDIDDQLRSSPHITDQYFLESFKNNVIYNKNYYKNYFAIFNNEQLDNLSYLIFEPTEEFVREIKTAEKMLYQD